MPMSDKQHRDCPTEKREVLIVLETYTPPMTTDSCATRAKDPTRATADKTGRRGPSETPPPLNTTPLISYRTLIYREFEYEAESPEEALGLAISDLNDNLSDDCGGQISLEPDGKSGWTSNNADVTFASSPPSAPFDVALAMLKEVDANPSAFAEAEGAIDRLHALIRKFDPSWGQ